jgi:hypothetical protein
VALAVCWVLRAAKRTRRVEAFGGREEKKPHD